MTKPKTFEQLRAEKERAETQLACSYPIHFPFCQMQEFHPTCHKIAFCLLLFSSIGSRHYKLAKHCRLVQYVAHLNNISAHFYGTFLEELDKIA